jgi:ADP-heptose:LPS heptosyltransferase
VVANGAGGDGVRVGPIGEPLPDVRRIAVLRGGGLGDLLFAVPAIESLRAAYPDAEIVLLGTPLHAALFADRPGPIDEVVTLPAARGVHEPAGRPLDDPGELATFVERVTQQPVDLAVQVHGGGRWSNPFLLELGPKWTVGARTPDAVELDRWLPYRYYQHEVLRALEVAGLAGAPPVTLEPRVTVTGADLDAAASELRDLPRPLVALHPGATDPRRRWPAGRFAEVAARAVDSGAGVVVVGAPDEADMVERISDEARARLGESRGKFVRPMTHLSVSALCGVLARCSVLVGNDSGPRHLARAVGVATVGVFWMGNVINAGPLGRSTDRVLIAWTAACPVCGVDCTREDLPRCEHDVSFVDSVSIDDVTTEMLDLLDAQRLASA